MSLPGRERLSLTAIDRELREQDPRLASLFAVFTRLNRGESMPRTERLAPCALRRLAIVRAPIRWVREPCVRSP
jgi:hypothetical protein